MKQRTTTAPAHNMQVSMGGDNDSRDTVKVPDGSQDVLIQKNLIID